MLAGIELGNRTREIGSSYHTTPTHVQAHTRTTRQAGWLAGYSFGLNGSLVISFIVVSVAQWYRRQIIVRKFGGSNLARANFLLNFFCWMVRINVPQKYLVSHGHIRIPAFKIEMYIEMYIEIFALRCWMVYLDVPRKD